MSTDSVGAANFESEPRCPVCEEPERVWEPDATTGNMVVWYRWPNPMLCDGCAAAAREAWEALPPEEQERTLNDAKEVFGV